MKKVSFQIVCHDPPGEDFLVTDFRLGRVQLYRHFKLTDSRSALDTRPRETALELLGEVPSTFESGRVPLFVCGCCADLGCGALSVAVEHTPEGVVWRDFGWDGWGKREVRSPEPPPDEDEIEEPPASPGEKGPPLHEILARTGPLLFDTDEYISAVSQYRHAKRSQR